MTTDPFHLYMFERGVFPALGVVVLVIFWVMGVFGKDYFAKAPVRELALPKSVAGVLLAVAMLAPAVLLTINEILPEPDTAAEKTPASLSLLQIIQMLLAFTGPMLFVFLVASTPDGLERFGVVDKRWLPNVGVGLSVGAAGTILAIGVSTLAVNIMLVLGQASPQIAHSVLQQLKNDPTAERIATTLINAVVMAPLLEEIVFRGLQQTLLRRVLGPTNRWRIILPVSLLFCLIHLPVAAPAALPSLFVLGVLFGVLYERTGSLWTPIIAHALFNAANIGMLLLTKG